MKELGLDDFLRLGPLLRRFLPVAVHEIWIIGSGAVAAAHADLPGNLRMSRDVDVVPIGTPVLYYDGQIIERELGEDSPFADANLFFVDYVTPALLRNTPPGWQERVTIIELAPGLRGHFLDPHDIAYNKLWAGRAKDIAWVRGIIETGVVRLQRLLELHETNPIPADDHAKVSRSLDLVTRQPT
ncbi:DUF6036 family nucleotidyltransferase [Prosthecobacter sp.]|uniref:DUF6036 family nucleotidyltransferase n=1 Tax=Prosthecobacter sp. TaxID=1965333 RepID=UPI0025D15896|nr:DUF6036 family nucleotidyltransferase [Prosthecobacter sp.]